MLHGGGLMLPALLLLASPRGANLLFAAGRQLPPARGVHVSRSALSGVDCLRNQRKNSVDPRPDSSISRSSFLPRSARRPQEETDDSEREWMVFSNTPPSRTLPSRLTKAQFASSVERVTSGAWSNKSAAAKLRWADPQYREEQLKKRRENAAPALPPRPLGVVVGPRDSVVRAEGPRDSVVFSPSRAQTQIWRSKADEINKWAMANQLRREKMNQWKQDPIGATNAHLEAGAELRSQLNNETFKADRREKRAEVARARWVTRSANLKAAAEKRWASLEPVAGTGDLAALESPVLKPARPRKPRQPRAPPAPRAGSDNTRSKSPLKTETKDDEGPAPPTERPSMLRG
ncbi:hypothetical protein T492DRAFT_1048512 [Pavlovales sp. CCMP2436]|nr:hypothetical protein T492DRAFT_1048512 [Pavlovales sp. CCMP2436]